MDASTLLLAIPAATSVGATFHARRRGNERREVALPGVARGLPGVKTGVTAIIRS